MIGEKKMKMSRIISRHVKRKIAAALIATTLMDMFPVAGYAEPLSWETEAAVVMDEQAGSEETAPEIEEPADPVETAPEGEEQISPEETVPEENEQDVPEETVPETEEPTGNEQEAISENAEPAEETAGNEDTVEEAVGTQENVSYKDENGADQNCNNYTVLEGTETSLNPGWYVVKQDKTYTKPVILNGPGEYHIILTDGKTMNIGTQEHPIGEFEVIPEGVGLGCSDDANKNGINLHIYAQSDGSDIGALKIYNTSKTYSRSSIGDAINVDNLTINGGDIYLNGGGSGSSGITSKNLTINDGKIEVEASSSGYGISSTGNISVNGGKITTDAVHSTGEIIINDGEINVTAQTAENLCGLDAGKITINNGKVTAKATGTSGHAINSTGNITVKGGTVIANATGSYLEFGNPGGCGLNAGGNITLSGNVTATATGMSGRGINSAGNITITGGTIKADATTGFDPRDMCGGRAINSDGDLTINGGDITANSGGDFGHAVVVGNNVTIYSGKFTAAATGSDGSGLYVGKDIIINGGEIKADSTYADDQYGGYGINTSGGNIIFNGGRVNARGYKGGIYAHEGNIQFNGGQVNAHGLGNGIGTTAGNGLSLSWKNVTDYISTNSLSIARNVTIETGKAFIDNEGHAYIAANASLIKDLEYENEDIILSPTTDSFYTVSFNNGGHGTVPVMQLLKKGSKVAEPKDLKKGSTDGDFICAGWYQDTGYQIKYDFTSGLTSDLYLYAKWVNKNSKDLDVKQIYRYDNGGSIYPEVRNSVGDLLTNDEHYTYTCKKVGSNTSGPMTTPGFYNLTVTGIGSYAGKQVTVKVCVLTFGECNPTTKVLNNNATLPANTDAAVVTDSTVTMNSGWYVVTKDVKVNSRMVVKGDVHLVLCDGTELDAGGNGGTMGISVTEGNSLTIYSQAGNTGKLKASSNEVNYYAGIGGDAPDTNDNRFPYLAENKNAGNITIHGGEIITKGSHGSAAIGMANGGNGGKITIYGGKVTARRFSSTGTGTDTGIGGTGADIHIAWCRQNDDYILSDGFQGTVVFDRHYINGNTIITGDNINNFPGQKIVPTESAVTYTVTFNSNGGTAIKAQPIAMGKTATKPVTPIKQGYKFDGWYKNSNLSGEAYDFSTPVNENFTLYAKWSEVTAINYIGEDGTEQRLNTYSPMEKDYTVLPSGYYYVGENIDLLNRVKVSGNVSLILGDDKILTADQGIRVMKENDLDNNTLNIFGKSGGTGELRAKGGKNNAAIGGDGVQTEFAGSVGNINIYGGIIRPQGGDDAAAIGGGRNNKYYGNICIYSGTVSGLNGAALGGSHGAALGSGFAGDQTSGKEVDGTVEILGGKVTVKSNNYGTGIGGGHYAYGGTINILGGQVHVTVSEGANEYYPGIGDGFEYNETKKAQITLGCREGQDDFIYSANYRGNVRVAPNQALKIKDTSTKFQGVISDPPSEIAGKTLVLGHSHKFTYDKSGTTITATCQNSGCDLDNNKATLTLSAPEESSLVYDGTAKPAIVIDEQHISGDEVVHYQKKNGNSWETAVTTAPKDAGIYRASITLADAETHSTATVSVTYTIKQRVVTITGLIANDKIYDDTTTASVNDTAIYPENTIPGDNVTIIPGNANFATRDAGENITVTFTDYSLGGTDAGNYRLVSQPASMTAAIRKRPVTISAIDQTVQFGDAITEMAARFDYGDNNGLLVDRDHKLTALTLIPDPDPRYASTSVENGTITAAGAVIKKGNTDVTQNYEITYKNGILKIIKIRAKVTKAPVARTNLKYDGYDIEYYDTGFGYTNHRIIDQALVDPGEADTKMEYKVEQISRGKGELLKNKDGSYVRDNAAPTEGYGGGYAAWESGSYHVWYRAASDNSHAPSEPVCLSVDIAQVPLTVRPVDETIVYGERFPSMNAVETGLVFKDDDGRLGMREYSYLIDGVWKKASDFKPSITQTYPDPGIYSVSVNYDGNGETYYCYDIHCVPGFLTVKPRTVSLNWGDTSFTYDGKIHVPTVKLSNLSKNEVPGAVGAVVTGAGINAGSYTATAVALSGDKADKYALPSDNTKAFSIEKANYDGNIPNVNVSVPLSAESFTASVAGKMPKDAGELSYSRGTISTNEFEYIEGGINVNVDENGLMTVTINREQQNKITADKKLFVNANVDSTNYNRKSITVVATFVDKKDAGVHITSGNSLSVNYSGAANLSLKATVSNPGTNEEWTWDSSNTRVATATGNGENCTVTIEGVGTTTITAKYDSDTATGYATTILTVNPISVSIPMAKTGIVYTGSKLTGVAADPARYTLTGETGTKPGNYIATAALKNTEHYRWSDGTIDTKYIPWIIEKKPGPAAPTGLTGFNPTTLENIDGKITGVSTNMEYSKDAAFSETFPCTGTEIIGLTPGIWYVRVKETDTVKAGATTAVNIIAVEPPVVRPINGLIYNGSPQVLVTADTISEGKIYYATADRFAAKPDANKFTRTIPTETNAGTYRVYYEIRGAGEVTSGYTDVTIAQKDLRNDPRWTVAKFNGLYGSEGMIDLSDHVPADDVRFGGIYHCAWNSDTWGLLDPQQPTVDLENYRVYYNVSEDKYFPETEKTKFVPLTVSMDEMQNYHAFNITVNIFMYKECSTNHADTVPLYNYRLPNCTEKGYTGDHWCRDCHAIFRGEDIPIDPDAHDFDYSNGEVTRPPTTLTWGEHTYHCRHNKDHTVTKQDIPPLPSDDGVDYSDFAEDVKSLSGSAAVSQNETVDPETGEVTKTIVVGGDEVSKIVKDPESGRETVESKIWVAGLQSSYTYTGSAIKPSFHVYDGTRKLTENKDYTVSFKDNKEIGTASILLKFKGNFKGTREQLINFPIVPAVLGKDIIAEDVAVAASKKAQKPRPKLIWAATGKTVDSKFFTVSYNGSESVKEEGTYTATITSKNKNYEGTATAKVTVVGKKGRLLSKATVKFSPKSYAYTGSEIVPAKGSYTLRLGGKKLVEGTDYRLVRVINNTDPGTATVIFEGMGTSEGSPAGTKTASFKIKGNRKLQEAGKDSDFTYAFSESVPYAKGGAKPALIIKDRGDTLKEGRDYTLSYAKNKSVTNGKKAEIKVKGKGNYNGSVVLKFEITPQSLNAKGITIEAADQFTTLKKLKKPSVIVTDADGTKLKAGTDYTVGKADTSAPGNTEESGEVFIIVTGKKNYISENSVKTSFRYMAVSSNMSKTKQKKNIAAKTYTGSAVRLGNNDLQNILYTGSRTAPFYLVPGRDFAVSGYKNNIKKGTAKVMLKGIGAYAGTKTLTFKIVEKKGDFKGALIGDKWQ